MPRVPRRARACLPAPGPERRRKRPRDVSPEPRPVRRSARLGARGGLSERAANGASVVARAPGVTACASVPELTGSGSMTSASVGLGTSATDCDATSAVAPAPAPAAAGADVSVTPAEARHAAETPGRPAPVVAARGVDAAEATRHTPPSFGVQYKSHLWPGQVLNARYSVRSEIGRGAFATVVRAWDPETQADVAIKVFRATRSLANTGTAEYARIYRLNRLDPACRTGVVRVRAYFTFPDATAATLLACDTLPLFHPQRQGEYLTPQHPCIVMQLHSRSLADVLAARRVIPMTGFASLCVSILRTLEFLARHGVVHTDVKPANIVVDSDWNATLVDFSNSVEVDTPSNAYMCTRPYRAPETILDFPAWPAADVWAFGCVAMEVLSGCVLMPGRNEVDQIHHIVDAVGVPSSEMLEESPNAPRFFHETHIGYLYTPLPPDWETAPSRSRDLGRLHYVHRTSKQVQWERPGAPGQASAAAAASTDTLPPMFRRLTSRSLPGMVYYQSMLSGVTQWTRPCSRPLLEQVVDVLTSQRVARMLDADPDCLVTSVDVFRAYLVSLIQRVFELDPKLRISAHDALRHPLFSQCLRQHRRSPSAPAPTTTAAATMPADEPGVVTVQVASVPLPAVQAHASSSSSSITAKTAPGTGSVAPTCMRV